MREDMTDRYRTTELGAVKINNNAITTIASIAAMEIKGVSKIGGGIGKTLFDFLCKKGTTKGVKIVVTASDIRLTVYITVEYGVDITRIADEVQENVKMAVEKMTGLVLSGVDVVVEGVKSPFPKDKTGGC
ncbi:MAG: Asp23/Gls24 family envelope stress response protein [Candidatus Omnitrophota bacterium]|nr:Asp23/Gls24 family envelope stress response protein [Candidatus Omnitrophota bacterium]